MGFFLLCLLKRVTLCIGKTPISLHIWLSGIEVFLIIHTNGFNRGSAQHWVCLLSDLSFRDRYDHKCVVCLYTYEHSGTKLSLNNKHAVPLEVQQLSSAHVLGIGGTEIHVCYKCIRCPHLLQRTLKCKAVPYATSELYRTLPFNWIWVYN